MDDIYALEEYSFALIGFATWQYEAGLPIFLWAIGWGPWTKTLYCDGDMEHFLSLLAFWELQ